MTVKELIHILGLLGDKEKEYTVIVDDLGDNVSVATFTNGDAGYILIQDNVEIECP